MKCKRKIRRNGSQEHQRRGKRNAGILKNVPDVQNGVERRKTKSFGVKNRMAQLSHPQSIFFSCRNPRAMGAPVIPREIRRLKRRDANQRSEGKASIQSRPQLVHRRRASAFMAEWSDGEDEPLAFKNQTDPNQDSGTGRIARRGEMNRPETM